MARNAAFAQTLASLGPLRKFLVHRMDELATSLEHKAIADFNNWLVRPAHHSLCVPCLQAPWGAEGLGGPCR